MVKWSLALDQFNCVQSIAFKWEHIQCDGKHELSDKLNCSGTLAVHTLIHCDEQWPTETNGAHNFHRANGIIIIVISGSRNNIMVGAHIQQKTVHHRTKVTGKGCQSVSDDTRSIGLLELSSFNFSFSNSLDQQMAERADECIGTNKALIPSDKLSYKLVQ